MVLVGAPRSKDQINDSDSDSDSLAKAGRYFQVADDEQHLSGVSFLSPPDADLRPSVFDRDV